MRCVQNTHSRMKMVSSPPEQGIQLLQEAASVLGCCAAGGMVLAPQMQAARMAPPQGELHLVTRLRGAFSDLAAVPISR